MPRTASEGEPHSLQKLRCALLVRSRGHWMQDVLPRYGWMVPGGHLPHGYVPAYRLNVPTGHGRTVPFGPGSVPGFVAAGGPPDQAQQRRAG